MTCIDSNVWIYYLDSTTEEHRAVKPHVNHAMTNEPLFMDAIVPLEVTHYLSARRIDSEEYVFGFLEMENLIVAPVTLSLVQQATALLQTHSHVGIGGRDASLVAAMEGHDIDELWTHDTGLKRLGDRLGWLTVVDPVEEDPYSPE